MAQVERIDADALPGRFEDFREVCLLLEEARVNEALGKDRHGGSRGLDAT